MLHELEHAPLAIKNTKNGANVCFWHKADIQLSPGNVCFWG